MQKIIRGKKYDTDTAKEVCCYSNNLPFGDFDWVQETLYVKRTGEYFLHGKGGARSKYAVPDGDFMGAEVKLSPYPKKRLKLSSKKTAIRKPMKSFSMKLLKEKHEQLLSYPKQLRKSYNVLPSKSVYLSVKSWKD